VVAPQVGLASDDVPHTPAEPKSTTVSGTRNMAHFFLPALPTAAACSTLFANLLRW